MPLTAGGAGARPSIPAVTLTTGAVFIVSDDCELDALVFCNTTAGAVTVTVQDGNGKSIVNALSIAAHATVQLTFRLAGNNLTIQPVGQFMKSGVQWFASANASIDAHLMVRHG
jgi:hypothetical protein